MKFQYYYDIHGITTVASTTWLPELKSFMVDTAIAKPNIRVHLGRLGKSNHSQKDDSQSNRRFMRYTERMGMLGFGAEIDIKDPNDIDILATPILKYSPHVLYTNLVEPVLRWNFVEKGYSLVHGACVAYGDDAYIVTARTDTGKTTTILRILDEEAKGKPISFISDDLTLIAPNGTVMTYPKPLTISYHTVAAVNSPLLSKTERFFLPLQSRIHSRSGRRLALLLAKTKLPMATINTFTQLLVPPPKYPVTRLVPHATMARKAKLSGLFVIERGGTGEVTLENKEAMEILLSNCDDAYGFPPYDTLEDFLCRPQGQDLRAVERQIVTQAFEGLPATLLRSNTLDWSKRIPGLISAIKAIPYREMHTPMLAPAAAAD